MPSVVSEYMPGPARPDWAVTQLVTGGESRSDLPYLVWDSDEYRPAVRL